MIFDLIVPDGNNKILVDGYANCHETSGQAAKQNQTRNDGKPNP
jgi:hypothetical protein